MKTELNKIYLGDCLEIIPKVIPDKSIDAVICDLPYGTTNCRWDTPIDLDALWIEYLRITKETSPIILFAQTPFDKILGASNIRMLRYEWIWEKTQATGHLNAKKMPMKAHENILVFYKKPPIYNPQITFGHKRKVSSAHHKRNTNTGEIYGKCDRFSDYDSTSRYPRSVVKFSSDKQIINLHPTQKPLGLIKYLIQTYTNPGDLILDNASGSGTLGVGCIDTGRNFIMIEKDPLIYNDSLNRMINHK